MFCLQWPGLRGGDWDCLSCGFGRYDNFGGKPRGDREISGGCEEVRCHADCRNCIYSFAGPVLGVSFSVCLFCLFASWVLLRLRWWYLDSCIHLLRGC